MRYVHRVGQAVSNNHMVFPSRVAAQLVLMRHRLRFPFVVSKEGRPNADGADSHLAPLKHLQPLECGQTDPRPHCISFGKSPID